ncbi:MAG: AMP-binding protein [Desulfobacterales bacterium]|nr:AMP-binding protein [Desulfobacterales bacterium]
MGLYDFTYYDLIRRNADIYSTSSAWHDVDTKQALTFGQVKARVDRLAAGLKAEGIQKGDRLGVFGKNSTEFFLLYGAAAALGAIMLPVNWRLSGEEACYNLSDGTPKLLFADAEFQETINAHRQKLPSDMRFFNLKTDSGEYDSFASLTNQTESFVPADVKNDDGFLIIHTAAVGGRPRGALLSHANLMCACLHLNYYFGLSEKDVHLNLLPLFHVAGLFMAAAAFQCGALNVNMTKFDAAHAAGLIDEFEVSLIFDFPPILNSILTAAGEGNHKLSSLKSVIGLGTAEDIERYQEMTQGTYFCMYGQTETAMMTTIGRYNDAPGSVGRPVILSDVRTINDDGHPLAAGEVGEIVMKGPLIFQGYWNLPDENAHTFRGGWHHTGDTGKFDEAGFLYYAGRKEEKELIKPGGENVYPAEVEKVILEHPAIENTVVFGVPDPKWKEGIKAVCLLKAGETLEAQTLIDFVGERIARFKKPHYVEMTADFPLKADGTPDREKIKERFGRG